MLDQRMLGFLYFLRKCHLKLSSLNLEYRNKYKNETRFNKARHLLDIKEDLSPFFLFFETTKAIFIFSFSL
jgi:hypothetical protein